MFANNKERNVADEAARARKILERNKPVVLSPVNLKEIGLSTTEHQVGEFAVVVLASAIGTRQYTVCRPIGFTDLSAEDWVILPTEEIPAALARSKDPGSGQLEQLRAATRTKMLISEKLLIQAGSSENVILFYPSDKKETRNSLLNLARKDQKAEVAALRAEMNLLPKKGSGPQRQILNARIQKTVDVVDYLPESVRADEVAIRDFIHNPMVVQKILKEHPTIHRTKVGPYGDTLQCGIVGARGYPLIDVVSALSKSMVNPDLSEYLGGDPTQAPKVPGASIMDALRGRGSKRGKKDKSKNRGKTQPPKEV